MECDICGEPIEPGQKFLVHEEDEDGPETLVHDVCPEAKPVVDELFLRETFTTHGTYDPDDDSTKTVERGYGE